VGATVDVCVTAGNAVAVAVAGGGLVGVLIGWVAVPVGSAAGVVTGSGRLQAASNEKNRRNRNRSRCQISEVCHSLTVHNYNIYPINLRSTIDYDYDSWKLAIRHALVRIIALRK
jgi:hypothetical protein